MRNLIDYLNESIMDDESNITKNVNNSLLEYMTGIFDQLNLSRYYVLEYDDVIQKVNIRYKRPTSVPAVWEAITYNTNTEQISLGNNAKSVMLPRTMFSSLVFINCYLQIITLFSEPGSDFTFESYKSTISFCPDIRLGVIKIHNLLKNLCNLQNSKSHNILFIDPIFINHNVNHECTFINSLSFKKFDKVYLSFNAIMSDVKQVEAKTLIINNNSVLLGTPGTDTFTVSSYKLTNTSDISGQSQLIDKFITNNAISSFGVVSNSVQYIGYYVWNEKTNRYDVKYLSGDKKITPKVQRR